MPPTPAFCVAEATAKGDETPDRFAEWIDFHNRLFAQQPPENTKGLDDSKLISIAKDAGVTGVSDCINDRQFGKWIADNTDKVRADQDIQGTPTVKINGKTVESPAGPLLKTAIDQALEAAK
ncbi:MAG: thioredoxin domain-containing protein [Gordonia sp. (in: high G+C Gram-positive bacteria)]|uniref:DsbA family protein n=1 Tax=Gordonia sp. (in: high G+C Gram-positive bacteria) TaxID=84139 RepID=UPI0039E5A07C